MATPTDQYNPILTWVPVGGVPSIVPPPPPGAQGYFYYWPWITHLTGGVSSTDLDAQDINGLPSNSVIEVVITDRGASQWKRTLDGTSPATDLNAGIIQPTNYEPSLRPYVLYRCMGF